MRSRKSPSIGRGLFLGSSALIQTLCSTATPLRAGKRTEQFRVVESFPTAKTRRPDPPQGVSFLFLSNRDSRDRRTDSDRAGRSDPSPQPELPRNERHV